ncbi:hypothetical protein BDV95DRAFT_202369 [Massariosphaeria phaeospora]|uniref:NAD-dependent epimerase/dehydratase domain-containing protein n=1 Tax=Massariosphaeria phaeospora TaxID=100035 RepID=A0A7C8I2P5_9PLEO|nr:hypothetical protein BDV95DRAFT_202369 [Massariosphaeria phaeospora]
MTKLFITGATGYIGGDALYAIANAYPDLEITALARNSDKGAKIAAQYSKIRLVYGDLDSTELITKETSDTDIVVHTANCDHEASANTIIAGLALRQKSNPAYLIHTSGTGILSFSDYESKVYGLKNEKVYDDWEGLQEVTSIPDTAVHRNVDKIILAAGEAHPDKIYTAIVCPPCIYGPGRGPDNQKSMQVYSMSRATLQRGKAFHVGDGNNLWTQVHVEDLSNLFLALTTAALQHGGKATWNSEGYYFCENGDFVWGHVARSIARIAHEKKLIQSQEIDKISVEEADMLTQSGSYLWGMNSRCRAIRAKKLLDWKPTQLNMFDMLPEIIDGEARELGITKGHAEKAAGNA